jgi:hypothetical protein
MFSERLPLMELEGHTMDRNPTTDLDDLSRELALLEMLKAYDKARKDDYVIRSLFYNSQPPGPKPSQITLLGITMIVLDIILVTAAVVLGYNL